MWIEGIVAMVYVVLVTIFVTSFVLECIGLPIISEQEWEIQHALRNSDEQD
jgi:hypothetical protein